MNKNKKIVFGRLNLLRNDKLDNKKKIRIGFVGGGPNSFIGYTHRLAARFDNRFEFVAGVAAYVRVVTVRITLINDWISFIPALLFANFVYFISLYYSKYSVEYFYVLKNSIFTFIFYQVLWGVFSLIINLRKI